MQVKRVPIYYREVIRGESHKMLMPFTSQPNLAAKLAKYISTEDEVKFLTSNVPSSCKYWVRSWFETISVRVHNSLINFVNDRTIRSDLVMFDYSSKNRNVQYDTKFVQYESNWVIKTRKEDVYVELVTRFLRTAIKQPVAERIKNWVMKKGSTAKTIPSVAYVVTLKIFDTPTTFYYIDLYKSPVDIPCGSDDPIMLSNIDFTDADVYYHNSFTMLRKEHANERAVHFRNK